MKKILLTTLTILFSLSAQALFEVKDASDNPVFSISDDGLRVFNLGDTLMVISASEIKANIMSSKEKGLSRSFSVTTSTTGKAGKANMLEVTTEATSMREGVDGDKYTDFSPQNIFLGLHAGEITTGYNNVFIGNESGISNIGGDNNTFSGYNSGFYNTSGSNNVFIGRGAGYKNESGGSNVFIGYDAGYSNISLGTNTYVGNSAGYFSTGSLNAFYGFASGYSNTGDYNSFFGQNSGSMSNYASNNCFFGYSAGVQCDGSNNVMMGSRSGYNNEIGTGNVFIGYEAGESEVGSNKLYIDNSDIATPLIYGEFDTNLLNFNVNKARINHLSGTIYGLYLANTSTSNDWHFYHSTTNNLYLYYNTTLRGTFNYTTGAYTSSSDKKFKKNIVELTSVLDKVMLLQPKKYNFISQKDDENKYIGLIAQDVEKIFPSFAHYNEEADTYTMDYAGMSVVAIQAIQEQQIIIDELKKENKGLNKRLDEIERLLKELK